MVFLLKTKYLIPRRKGLKKGIEYSCYSIISLFEQLNDLVKIFKDKIKIETNENMGKDL